MRAKTGDTVKVHYTGMLADGTVFDSSFDRQPLQITLGSGEAFPGFERAIVGLKPGTLVIENIPAGHGFETPGHTLDDKDLTFEIQLVEIVDAVA